MKIENANKKTELYWILYDCGCTAYSLIIITAIFPIYFSLYQKEISALDLGYWHTLASLFIALLSPILGTIADYKNFKKRFFIFFFAMGLLTTLGITLLSTNYSYWLLAFFVLSNIGYAGANVFFDAFLVDITTKERMDTVSTKSYAFGYLASVIPFVASLLMIFFIGETNLIAYQLCFGLTVIWWALFTYPMIRHVRQIHYIDPEPRVIYNSFKRLKNTFLDIKQYKVIFIFLLAYFFYIDGINTIVKMIVPWATSVLGENLDQTSLLVILLLFQFVAGPCALLSGKLSQKFGAIRIIQLGILIYIFTVVIASIYPITSVWHIFILSIFIASAQGGTQALSRSYFAQHVPANNANEFFGFYNIFGKFAAILGPVIISLTHDTMIWLQKGSEDISQSAAQISLMGILPLFVIGLVITFFLPKTTK